MSAERARGGDAADSEPSPRRTDAVSHEASTPDESARPESGDSGRAERSPDNRAERSPDDPAGEEAPAVGSGESDGESPAADVADAGAESLATHPDSVEDVGPGRRLGIDVGGVRIGLAVSDPAPVLATPVETVRRDRRKGTDVRRVAKLVAEYEVVEVVVGLPVTLAGEHKHAAEMARGFANALASRIAPVPVRFSDERLTTVTASRMLFERGVRGKQQRSVVDQAAAVEILQSWLDARGRAAGKDSW